MGIPFDSDCNFSDFPLAAGESSVIIASLFQHTIEWGQALMNFRTSIGVTLATVAGLACLTAPQARAQANPGDPLFCDPNEGVTFLIVNGASGIFTVNSDCYGGNPSLDTQTTITTSQGGVLTKGAGTSLNYTYTPPTPGFTGLDTFSINVTTVCNRNPGGAGSAGGTTCPGGPATLSVTLNVLPSTSSFTTSQSTGLTIPIPPGSVSNCTANPGNSGTGPIPGAVLGCTTGVVHGVGVNPSHGTLSTSGSTIVYTPAAGFQGVDTFTYQVQGVNTDGNTSLNSGNVTANVTVGFPGTPIPPTWSLVL
jgi:hypothetical protein